MERITRFRITAMIAAIGLLLGFYAFRLYSLQIVEVDENSTNITTFTTMTRVKAARGDILDRNGNVLVGNRASYDIVINNYVLTSSTDPNGSLYNLVKLCQELGIEYTDNFPVTKERPFTYTLDQQNATWQGYFQTYLSEQGSLDSDITAPLLIKQLRSDYGIPEEWTDEEARAVIGIRYELRLRGLESTGLPTYVFLEDAEDSELSAILEINVPGLSVEASTVREYYTDYAAHILGYVGAMDSDQWAYYQELGYSMDAEVGQTGIEEEFEEYLHGTDGWRVDEVTTDGTVINSYWLDGVEPQAGNNVELTIDIELQEVAEKALDFIMKYLNSQDSSVDGSDAEGAAVVAMVPGTGEVLVMASYPTYTMEDFFNNYDVIRNTDYNPLYNRAIQATYPPGSVYKMSMAVAAIDSHTVSSTDTITDKGIFDKYYEESGMTYACSTYTSTGGATDGDVNTSRGLTVSCNYYFYTLADKMSIETMDAAAKALGLGEPTGIELDEDIGHRSTPEIKKEVYGESYDGWYVGDKILTGIGQGENMFSPLQLCVYTSTVAMQGTRYAATILNRVVSADYRELVVDNDPEILSHLDISDEAYNAIKEGMNGVVNDRDGTAWQSFNENKFFGGETNYYPCPYNDIICAKTGTSEHGSGGSDNGSFVAFAPMDDPEIAIAVYGEKVGHGYSMAYVARTMLEYYLGAEDVEGSSAEIYENIPN